jgi:nucleotide-binding universal stress UspA family protein
MPLYRTILVAHDFSVHAQAAAEHAVALVELTGADLHLLHVVVPPIAYPTPLAMPTAVPPVDLSLELRRSAEEALAVVACNLPCEAKIHVVVGSPAVTICEMAEKVGAELIVMGTHGRTGLAHVFLGSVAERTLRRAPCPVLTVRTKEDDSGAH